MELTLMNFNINLNIGDRTSTINVEANTFIDAINKAKKLYEIMELDSENLNLHISKSINNNTIYQKKREKWVEE